MPQPAMIVGPEERVWGALGDGYTRLIALALGTCSHIAGLQNTAIVVLNGQNQRLQRLVEELSGDLIQLEIGAYEVLQTGAGRVIASARPGLSPELVEPFETVDASPDLSETRRSPDLRRLLEVEKTRTSPVWRTGRVHARLPGQDGRVRQPARR